MKHMPFPIIELRGKDILFKKASFKDVKEIVYTIVQLIPMGYTVTYGDVAKILKINPKTVGKILSENIQPIVIPCHRVISSRGFGGYTLLGKKALDFKIKLLQLESSRAIHKPSKFDLRELLGLDN